MATEMDRQLVEEIVRRIITELDYKIGPGESKESNTYSVTLPARKGDRGVFDTVEDAVTSARHAYHQWRRVPLESRRNIIEAIRQVGRNCAEELAKMAREETGFGRVECKTNKNLLVAEKTPGVDFLVPTAFSGDHGLTLIEPSPYGVIASITPITNPTATTLNNIISILSAGNTVVFNVHPGAKNVSNYLIQLINKTIHAMGGPENLIATIKEPTIESAKALMVHPDINLVVVTGGGEVVKVAMKSGKRAICAGPGNPPVVVDETADIEKAARDIVSGCSFDNNLACTDEKEVFVVESVADKLKLAMQKYGAFEVPRDGFSRLENLIFTDRGIDGKHAKMNLKWIGQNADLILNKVGFNVDQRVRLAILEVHAKHPLVLSEQMMPILPIVRCRNVDEAMELAYIAEHGFRHTAVIHSLNLPALNTMARLMDTSILVKNAPSYAGIGFNGEGYTSFSIGTYTGEGLTSCRTFSRDRRCALIDYFRIT